MSSAQAFRGERAQAFRGERAQAFRGERAQAFRGERASASRGGRAQASRGEYEGETGIDGGIGDAGVKMPTVSGGRRRDPSAGGEAPPTDPRAVPAAIQRVVPGAAPRGVPTLAAAPERRAAPPDSGPALPQRASANNPVSAASPAAAWSAADRNPALSAAADRNPVLSAAGRPAPKPDQQAPSSDPWAAHWPTAGVEHSAWVESPALSPQSSAAATAPDRAASAAPPAWPTEPSAAPPGTRSRSAEQPAVEQPAVEQPAGRPRPERSPAAARRPLRWPWSRRARPADAAVARLRAMAEQGPASPRPAAARPMPPESASAPEAPNPAPNVAPDAPAVLATLAWPSLPPLRLPLRPLIEGLGLLALLAGADAALTGGTGFAHWPASPFAVPVLYVAARHGLVPGVSVALAAGLLRIGLALSSDLWTAGAWALPLAWPCVAALVGGFADLARHRLEAARATAEAAEADRDAIAEANARLAERAMELDASLGARLQATTAVFEAARILGSGTEGVIRGATGLMRAATGCAACSFWLAEDRTLHLVAAEGWPPASNLAQTLLPGPLFDALGLGRGALVATRPGDRVALGGQGILAAAVLSPWDGAMLGMVKIEDIGFTDLGFDTIAALEAAAGWIGAALAEARAQESAEAASGVTGSIGMPGGTAAGGGLMVPGEDAARAIAVMTRMARRLGFELALLSAEIPAGPRGAAALEATRAAMAEAFRGSDLLLESRLEDRRLSILLPGAAVAGAESAASRLRLLLAERAPAATAQVVVGIALLHGVAGGGWQLDLPGAGADGR